MVGSVTLLDCLADPVVEGYAGTIQGRRAHDVVGDGRDKSSSSRGVAVSGPAL